MSVQPLHHRLRGACIRWDEDVAGYFDGLGPFGVSRMPSPVAPGHSGLFAGQAFGRGETLCSVRPWLAAQMVANRSEVLACAGCLVPLGTIEQQVDLLSGAASPGEAGACVPDWQISWRPSAAAGAPFVCGCGEAFCSQACLEEVGHQYLCVATLPEEHAEETPLYRFKLHALQTNSLYLLGGKLLARLASAAGRDGSHAIVEQLSPVAWMMGRCFWEISIDGDDGVRAEASLRTESLKNEALAALELLRETFLDAPKRLHVSGRGVRALEDLGVFDGEFWGNLLGCFQMNNFAIVLDSPVKEYLQRLSHEFAARRASGAPQAALEQLLERAPRRKDDGNAAKQPRAGGSRPEDLLRNERDFCPPLDGVGVIPLLALANHSCGPNAKVVLQSGSEGGILASLVATEPIAAGAEIFHSYVDEQMRAPARRQELRRLYGFDCKCRKCGDSSGTRSAAKQRKLK